MTAQLPNSNSDIINLLWTLKQLFNKSAHHTSVEFTDLLNDPAYRNRKLEEARQSDDHRIRQLAQSLQQVPVPASLFNSKRGLNAPIRNPKPVLARAWRRSLVVVLVVVLCLSAFSSWYPKLYTMVTNTVVVDQDIGTDTVWRTDRTYLLTTDIFVHDNARLTVQPGTLIKGERGSSLIVSRGSQLIAVGRQDAPIVFTSSQPIGSRVSGDWGGLVLLGEDRTNKAFTRVEGVDNRDIRGQFGGQVEQGSCGTLNYVRIEYAGYEAFPDNELNGLTLAGCGPQTDIDYVQVHRALDDGIELFGGSANLRHIVISGARDDSLDWDLGWDGKVQFLVVQQYPDRGDRAFEGDNSPHKDHARPRSNPLMSNVTLLGSHERHTAMVLRSGTAGRFHNFLLAGYGSLPIDMRGDLTADLATRGDLHFDALFVDSPVSRDRLWRPETGQDNNDAGFDEGRFLLPVTVVKPGLVSGQAFDMQKPEYAAKKPVHPTSRVSFPDSSAFWDSTATYVGAVDPEDSRPWYRGWTEFSDG